MSTLDKLLTIVKMSLQGSSSRLLQTQLRQLSRAQSLPGTSYCSCSGSAASWTARSRWQSTRLQSTSSASAASQSDLAPPEEHDIVIVGGGLVGLALANALCMSDRDIGYRVMHATLTTIVYAFGVCSFSYIFHRAKCWHKSIAARRQRSQ